MLCRRSARARGLGAALALLLAGQTAALTASAATPTPAPPPTPVPPLGSPSPFVTRLRTPEPDPSAPAIEAPAAALADLDSGQVLYAKEGEQRRPVASLTKIMTALLVLERTDPSDLVAVSPEATAPDGRRGLAELGLLPGERITARELLYALMLQSANDAALALAEHVSGSVDRFVRRMNRHAERLGAGDTRFYSPNGLDDRGYSTALDLVRLTRAAFRFPLFSEVVGAKFHEIPAPRGGEPRRIQNRNVLLWLYPGAIGVKTGFTAQAGFCVVAVAEREGVRLVTVVLGSRGEAFSDAAALLNFGFEGFERRALVEEGDSFGWVDLLGGRVPVVAAGTLEALVPTAAGSEEPSLTTRVLSQAAFPPLPGEPVGRVVALLADLRLGSVALLAAEVPPPPEPAPGPWWRRAAGAVLDGVMAVIRALIG